MSFTLLQARQQFHTRWTRYWQEIIIEFRGTHTVKTFWSLSSSLSVWKYFVFMYMLLSSRAPHLNQSHTHLKWPRAYNHWRIIHRGLEKVRVSWPPLNYHTQREPAIADLKSILKWWIRFSFNEHLSYKREVDGPKMATESKKAVSSL